MSIEPMINRMIGQAETGGGEHLSHEESRQLSQRLRELVAKEADEAVSPDRGAAAEALLLAAYLDGGMDPAERAAYERELTYSPERRDELVDAAAWLDVLAARSELPPADATELLMTLDTPAAAPPPRGRGLAALIEWLLPRPRLAIATSALATLAIAGVSLDLALHFSPLRTTFSPPATETVRTFGPIDSPNTQTMRPMLPNRILLTAETINAMVAYQENPSEQQRSELLRALIRAGAPAIDTSKVQSIAVLPRLAEWLRQRGGRLPAAILATLSPNGTLTLENAD
jgi:hypothetical protein